MSPRTKKILAASAAVVLVAFFLWRHWSHGNAAADEDDDHATAVEGSQDSEANRLRAARKYERGAKVPSCVVEGSVESPDGPVAGATVHLSPQRPDLIAAANPGKTIDSITATTDERGRFSIRVADGPYSAAVSHPDYLATGRDVGLACETRGLRFRLQEGGVLLEGEVKDILGGPVGGALVSV
ncbi:MAG: carboxypeptidase-like regulatory domain-containing protein, partial [Deltaproteobacteria bacterium]|nr:carboxypeptidase-like regulatory domain-containing protein [Deltaproteobacteria bacterium]